ncbi:Heavy metal transport/detoxification superfamily protein [Trifolium repens]|nr:Heavy metal transport/detoxification superfamily protein [Trifolium repens]
MGRIQLCILKVDISCQCEGCEKKVKKVLLKIQGVIEVKTYLEERKVRVVGDVDPNELIKNLKKYSGKHAEICSIHNGGNHIAKKNDNEEGKKKSTKGKGCFLGPLFIGFAKKSKNNTTCHGCECSNGGEGSNGFGKKSKNTTCNGGEYSNGGEGSNGFGKKSKNTTCNGGEGSNGNMDNNNGYMQEHSMMNNGDSEYHHHHHHHQGMQLQMQPSLYENMDNNNGYMQERSMMNNGDSEYHHHQGMQMQIMQPSLYDQQQYMAMRNQQQGNMNMYPSNMMYGGGPYSSMNYMPPQQMLTHPNYMANPTHNENAEGYWIM